jgi:hypothetical protein
MKRLAVIFAGCVVLVAAVVGGIAAVRFVRVQQHERRAAERLPAAEQEWRREFGDPAKRLAEFPRVDDNASAARLVELARAVGIQMERPQEGKPAPRELSANRAVAEHVRDYFEKELTRSEDEVGPPPAPLRDFFDGHGPQLDAIVAFLTSSEPPVWKSEAALGPEASLPNLLGQIRLQKILVARCLSDLHAGRQQDADRVLTASWTLNQSLGSRVDIVSQLIGTAVARMHVGLARRLAAPGPWRARLAGHDYRASLLRAMEVEKIGHLRHLAGSSRYARATRADYLDLSRILLVGFRDAPVGDGPLAPRFPKDGDATPGGVLVSVSMPNLAEAVRRADRLMVDIELTDRVLQARELRAKLGNWPQEIPGFAASRMPDAHWIYAPAAGGDGKLSISLSRELRWEGGPGLHLPLSHVLDGSSTAPTR